MQFRSHFCKVLEKDALNLLNLRSLEFYHNLLQRDELNEIFLKYSVMYAGLAMTTHELKRFLQIEQVKYRERKKGLQILFSRTQAEPAVQLSKSKNKFLPTTDQPFFYISAPPPARRYQLCQF